MGYQTISPDIVNNLMDYIEVLSLYSKCVRVCLGLWFLVTLINHNSKSPGRVFLLITWGHFHGKHTPLPMACLVKNILSLNVLSRQLTTRVQPHEAHEDLMIYNFPCYWPECRACFNALIVCQAHLVQYWHWWMARCKCTEANRWNSLFIYRLFFALFAGHGLYRAIGSWPFHYICVI